MLAIHHLTQLRTLTSLHCNISTDVDANNLHVVGFSSSRSKRSISTSGKNPPVLRTVARKHPGGRVSLPSRQTTDVGVSGSRWYFLLGFFPAPGTSYFFTFSVDASDSLLMECSEPMHIDTEHPNCTVVLPQGAVAYSGTTAGALICWNFRYGVRVTFSCCCTQVLRCLCIVTPITLSVRVCCGAYLPHASYRSPLVFDTLLTVFLFLVVSLHLVKTPFILKCSWWLVFTQPGCF